MNVQNKNTPAFQAKYVEGKTLRKVVRNLGDTYNGQKLSALRDKMLLNNEDVDIFLVSGKAKSGEEVPIAVNTINGNIVGFFPNFHYKMGSAVTELTEKLTDIKSKEYFELFLNKGIRSRNNKRAVLDKLQETINTEELVGLKSIKNYPLRLVEENKKMFDDFSDLSSKYAYKPTCFRISKDERMLIKKHSDDSFIFVITDSKNMPKGKSFIVNGESKNYSIEHDENTLPIENVYNLYEKYIPMLLSNKIKYLHYKP